MSDETLASPTNAQCPSIFLSSPHMAIGVGETKASANTNTPHLPLPCHAGSGRARFLNELAQVAQELRRLNTYYLSRERSAIAKAQDLDAQLRSAAATASGGQQGCGCSIPAGALSEVAAAATEFHCELVQLRRWSLLNAAAVAESLKRLDEATGRRFGSSLMSVFVGQQVRAAAGRKA